MYGSDLIALLNDTATRSPAVVSQLTPAIPRMPAHPSPEPHPKVSETRTDTNGPNALPPPPIPTWCVHSTAPALAVPKTDRHASVASSAAICDLRIFILP